MKGDFSRETFDKAKHFSRVLMQQGRVQLDADWNEQTAILLHYLQALAADLIGPHGGPAGNLGFAVVQVPGDPFNFQVGKGHYYVDGVLCENEGKLDTTNFSYLFQPNYPLDKDKDKLTEGRWLVYLDVWERHLTYIEVESPDDSVISIREVALGGPDTATRAQIVWQAKTTKKMPDGSDIPSSPPAGSGWRSLVEQHWPSWMNQWQPTNRGKLKAQAKKGQKPDTEPCITSPESRYRGKENQLYRVEIHKGGTMGTATFKWSRENGSVIFPIISGGGTSTLTLENLGRDGRFSLKKNDWVEVQDDDYVLHNRAGKLLQVNDFDRVSMTVTLNDTTDQNVGNDPSKHPLLRRWDHKKGDPNQGGLTLANDGAALIEENKWLTLEEGVQVQFQPSGNDNQPNEYRTGDYWLIPARTATGDVEWPRSQDGPTALPPHGVVHHYAPLAVITVKNDGTIEPPQDCRLQFKALATP